MIGWLLGTRMGRWASLVAAALGALFMAFLVGWTRRGQAEGEAALQAYRKIREKIDEVELGNDPDAARRWLRERAKR